MFINKNYNKWMKVWPMMDKMGTSYGQLKFCTLISFDVRSIIDKALSVSQS